MEGTESKLGSLFK